MKRKILPDNPFQTTVEHWLFTLKTLSIWRLQYFSVCIRSGMVKRMELKNNTTGCFTE